MFPSAKPYYMVVYEWYATDIFGEIFSPFFIQKKQIKESDIYHSLLFYHFFYFFCFFKMI